MDSLRQTLRLNNRNPIMTLDISSDGESLVVGQQGDYTGNANLTLWAMKEMKLLTEIERTRYDHIESARFMFDNKTLVYIKNETQVNLYDLEILALRSFCLTVTNAVRLSPAKWSHRLVINGAFTEVWDIEQERRIWSMPEYVASETLNLRPAIADIMPDGSKVAVAGASLPEILIYNIDNNELIGRLENAPVQAHCGSLGPGQGYFAVIGLFSRGIYIWNLQNGKRHLPHIFGSDIVGYWSLCFCPTGEYLAVGTLVGYVTIFRLSDGKRMISKKVHEGRVWDIKFTPDGKKLISGGDDGLVGILELDL